MVGEIEAMADQVSKAMSDYMARGFAAMNKKMAEMQAKVDALPVPKDGKDAEVDYSKVDRYVEDHVNAAMATALSALPKAKDGEAGANGKDADPVDIESVVKLVIAAVPTAKDGDPGKDAEVDYTKVWQGCSDLIAQQIAALPKAKDGVNGTSVDAVQVKAMIDESVDKAVSAIPKPIDGISITGEPGEPGEPGENGRDALQIDILDGIDAARGYPRGTYASYKGGIIRAHRNTDPIVGKLTDAGWSVVVDGIAEIAVDQGDDLRTFAFGFETCAGKTFVRKFVLPVVLDRGPFEREKAYAKGDSVTWDGSTWIAQSDVENSGDRPGQPDWRLSVKRGRDGKNFDDPAPRHAEVVRLK